VVICFKSWVSAATFLTLSWKRNVSGSQARCVLNQNSNSSYSQYTQTHYSAYYRRQLLTTSVKSDSCSTWKVKAGKRRFDELNHSNEIRIWTKIITRERTGLGIKIEFIFRTEITPVYTHTYIYIRESDLTWIQQACTGLTQFMSRNVWERSNRNDWSSMLPREARWRSRSHAKQHRIWQH